MKRSTVAINKAKKKLTNVLVDKDICGPAARMLKLMNQIKKCKFITKHLKYIGIYFFVEYDVWEEVWHEIQFVYKSKSKKCGIWILLYPDDEYELITARWSSPRNDRERRYDLKLDQFRKFY